MKCFRKIIVFILFVIVTLCVKQNAAEAYDDNLSKSAVKYERGIIDAGFGIPYQLKCLDVAEIEGESSSNYYLANLYKIVIPKDGRVRVNVSSIDSFGKNNSYRAQAIGLFDEEQYSQVTERCSSYYPELIYYSFKMRMRDYNIEGGTTCWATIKAGTYYVGVDMEGITALSKIVIDYEAQGTYNGESVRHDTFDSADNLMSGVVYQCDDYNDKSYDYEYGDEYYGYPYSKSDDIYRFTMEVCGKVTIDLNTPYQITNSDSREKENIYDLYSESADGNVEKINSIPLAHVNLRLPQGSYYIVYRPKGEYTICATTVAESASQHEQEFNNASPFANEISVNQPYMGNINYGDDKDYYKFTINNKSNVVVSLKIPRQSSNTANVKLYDHSLKKELVSADTNRNPVLYLKEQILEAGTYYVCVSGKNDFESDYTLTVNQADNCELNKTKLNLKMGKTGKLSLKGAKGNVAWTSSNKKVATVT